MEVPKTSANTPADAQREEGIFSSLFEVLAHHVKTIASLSIVAGITGGYIAAKEKSDWPAHTKALGVDDFVAVETASSLGKRCINSGVQCRSKKEPGFLWSC